MSRAVKTTLCCLGWVAMILPAVANADPAALAKAFGRRETVDGMELSPSGLYVSYLTPVGADRSAVMIADVVSGQAKPILTDTESDARLRWCEWKSDDRLICGLTAISNATGMLLGYSRMVAVDRDGKNLKIIGQRGNSRSLGYNQDSGSIADWLPDDPDNVLMQVDLMEEVGIGTRLYNKDSGLAAQRVDIRTGRATTIERARDNAAFMMTDGHGKVRIMGIIGQTPAGYMASELRYMYRPKGSDDWKYLGSADLAANSGLAVEGFDESGDWIYALRPKDGRQALYRLAIDGSNRAELVFAHPKVDVTGVKRIGKYGRPVAATYVVDATEYKFFDPQLEKLSTALSKALPGNPAVTVVDESWDGTRKLVFAGSDIDPGRYYLFDTKTRELAELTSVRSPLASLKLAAVTSISYPARDQVAVPGYLTLPPGKDPRGLPAIIMPHGGPSARDQWGFDWLAQYFAQLGYAVLQANYRGSSGYGEAWYANNGFKSWETAIADINDGARWLVAQGIADPKRLAIFGWSYGGYAALQANVLDPSLYKAAVAVAPVTDLGMLKTDARRFTNYRLVSDFVGSGPHIESGSPARNAAHIQAPVMLFHGSFDLNVEVGHVKRMDEALAAAGKPRETIIYPGLGHSLDDSNARADMLQRSAAFFEQHLSK